MEFEQEGSDPALSDVSGRVRGLPFKRL